MCGCCNAKLGDDSGGGTAMTQGQTVKLGSNVTMANGAFQVFWPLNTKLCPGLEIYVDATSTSNLFVLPLEDSLPG